MNNLVTVEDSFGREYLIERKDAEAINDCKHPRDVNVICDRIGIPNMSRGSVWQNVEGVLRDKS